MIIKCCFISRSDTKFAPKVTLSSKYYTWDLHYKFFFSEERHVFYSENLWDKKKKKEAKSNDKILRHRKLSRHINCFTFTFIAPGTECIVGRHYNFLKNISILWPLFFSSQFFAAGKSRMKWQRFLTYESTMIKLYPAGWTTEKKIEK